MRSHRGAVPCTHANPPLARVEATRAEDSITSGGHRASTLVIHDNDALRGDLALRHLEGRRDGAIGKQTLSGAQRERIDLEPQLVDQIMLEERLKEIRTSVNVKIRPWLLLEPADVFPNVSAQNHGRPPLTRGPLVRGNVLGRGHDGRPKVRMLRPIWFPDVEGPAP